MLHSCSCNSRPRNAPRVHSRDALCPGYYYRLTLWATISRPFGPLRTFARPAVAAVWRTFARPAVAALWVVRLGDETVTSVANCQEMSWLGRINLEGLPQAADELVRGPRLYRTREPPHVL